MADMHERYAVSRRRASFLGMAALALALLLPQVAAAQNYPNKPVRLILPFGVFATVGATGLLSGDFKQFTTQVIAVVAAAAYALIVTLIIAFVLDKTIGLRVEKEEEIMGLDTTQHSESAYN